MKLTLPLLSIAIILLLSCRQSWTEKHREEFIQGCYNKASREIGSANAEKYCRCMQAEIEKLYPDVNDVKYLEQHPRLDFILAKCRADSLHQEN